MSPAGIEVTLPRIGGRAASAPCGGCRSAWERRSSVLTGDRDPEAWIFSFVENGATADPNAIKDAMDDLAATVNGCYA